MFKVYDRLQRNAWVSILATGCCKAVAVDAVSGRIGAVPTSPTASPHAQAPGVVHDGHSGAIATNCFEKI
jgi:hypothetical protein